MVVVTVRVVYIYVNVIFSKDNNKNLLKKAYQGCDKPYSRMMPLTAV